MKWKNIPTDISEYQGFVYKIEHIETGRYYLGKKFFWEVFKKKPTKYLMKDGKYVKNKKNKRVLNTRTTRTHIKKETDWKDYWGSNKALLNDIMMFGEKRFERRIIKLCKTKFDCAYEELKIQMECHVLFDPLSYNEIINIRLRRRK